MKLDRSTALYAVLALAVMCGFTLGLYGLTPAPDRTSLLMRVAAPVGSILTVVVAGISARVAYVESMLAVLGRIASGLRRSKRSAAFSTSAPERSSRTAIRQEPSTSRSRVRQSGAGTTSSSISNMTS